MVVKIMRWPPWMVPPFWSKKLQVTVSLRVIEGLSLEVKRVFFVELQWKGHQKGMLKRSIKKNLTKEGCVGDYGLVDFDEEFRNVCNFSGPKEGLFYPWELAFTVFNDVNQGLKNRAPVFGTASLNLAEFAAVIEGTEFVRRIPLNVPGCTAESSPSLILTLSMLEVRTGQEVSRTVQGFTSPVSLSPRSLEALSPPKDEFSAVKAGLRKVKTFKDYVSSRKAKKIRSEEDGSDSRSSVRSEDAPCHYPFDTDSLDDDAGEDSEESKEEFRFRHSVSYESLARANCARGSFYSNNNVNGKDECWIYYSNRRSDVGCPDINDSSTTVFEEILQRSLKRSILPWKKRKMNFSKSPKAKGEPLLKKHYGEDGGDDIDFDRRQLSSSDESSLGWGDGSTTNRSSFSEFGDDNFAVGSWESKEINSRDGLMKLQTQVFFASIDQRSERAAGESACTALVAVLADWLLSNHDEMPIKSEFDGLIRDGSSEWRNLCENKVYMERFLDKHFDLETILQAKIRPLNVAPEKSFIGFFRPEGLEEGDFDFLHGAMSFDSIWDEISRSASNLPCNHESSMVYIVSWNDHFFVLKVERDAYYIIDTLGERLFEGCNQAYVLKFDKDATIQRLPKETKNSSDKKPTTHKGQTRGEKATEAEVAPVEGQIDRGNEVKEEEIICEGKESCKEYIKSFLAAIPIRELQADFKKGLMASTPIHHRLQVEFHYTKLLQPLAKSSGNEVTVEAPAMAMTMETEMAVVVAVA